MTNIIMGNEALKKWVQGRQENHKQNVQITG